MKKYMYLATMLLCMVACQYKEPTAKVNGRYVPERKDDFAWENEYAAFRLYGPALLPENPSNGVDLWLKASPEMIIDTFYYSELVLHRPYHINYGKGLDCYKVGHTAGCGGVVILTHDSLWTGGPYSRWQVLEQTPERFSFRLYYDSVPVAGRLLRQSLTVTAEAGKILNKAEVVLYADDTTAAALPALWVGGGIFLHDTLDHVHQVPEAGLVAYAEDALSDKQAAQMNYLYNGSTSQGRSYSCVFTPLADRFEIVDGTFVAARAYNLGDTLTYYFGGGWSLWQNGEQAFPNDKNWFHAVMNEARGIHGVIHPNE